MAESIEQIIRRLAVGTCEYCKDPDNQTCMRHVLDHVIALQHGGKAAMENLALCCPGCNAHKRPNIASVDPTSGQIVRLFHPRKDRWEEHFQYRDLVLHGLSEIGRATVVVLAVNLPLRVFSRKLLRENGEF